MQQDLSEKVLTAPSLKRLYFLLLQLSLGLSCNHYKLGDISSMFTWDCWFAVKIMFKDIGDLSDVLFKALLKQFKQLTHDMDFVPSTMTSKQAGQYSDLIVPLEDFPLLLRCCMVILLLLEFDCSLVLEKFEILVTMLRTLCSSDLRLHVCCCKLQAERSIINTKRSVSHECIHALDGSVLSILEELDSSMCFAEQTGSQVPFLCSILEAFTDELLVHQHLRHYFVITDSLSSGSKVFISQGGPCDVVLEVISAHFLLSVSDRWALVQFSQMLFWSLGRDFKIPQLSLTAALIFLRNPVILTAPKVFQAHLISLASECIGIHMDPNSMQLNPLLLSNYMSAFEQSVNMYRGLDFSVMEPCILEHGLHSTFESHVQRITYDEINLQIAKLVDSCNPYFQAAHSRTKSGLLSACMTYVKESQYILDDACRDETCSILNCIIERTISEEIGMNAPHKNREISQQEIFLLASVLKLMCCSLLQLVWFMRKNGNLICLKNLKDFSLRREYDFMLGIISCFRQHSANKPIQKILHDAMETHSARNKETRLMLVHFTGLLSFSLDRGPDFLWKGCIFMMMSVMNLLFFEEGNLDALKPLLGCTQKPSFSVSCSAKIQEGPTCQSSSRIVALNLQKIKMLYLRERCKPASYDIGRVDAPVSNLAEMHGGQPEISQYDLHIDEENDTCNGETFLKCRNGSSDCDDDLADFIVCKRGKDYSSWLKKRERFRRWRNVVLRERRRSSWEYVKYFSRNHL